MGAAHTMLWIVCAFPSPCSLLVGKSAFQLRLQRDYSSASVFSPPLFRARDVWDAGVQWGEPVLLLEICSVSAWTEVVCGVIFLESRAV